MSLWKNLKYLAAYSVPLGAFLGIYLKGGWTWTVVLVAFVGLPLMELILPFSKNNPNPQDEEKLSSMVWFDYLLYLHVPLIYILLFYFLEQRHEFTRVELIGMLLSMGVLLGTMGINIAHELGHRNTELEKWLARFLLLPANYLHFTIEHNRGHHKYVCTPEDPATARLNESLYAFWVRSVFYQYLAAWKWEREDLERRGKKFWSLHNHMLTFLFSQIAFALVIFLLFDSKAIILYLTTSFLAVLLLETVNYIEHYGLRRKELESGYFEVVKPSHSWNSSHELGRIFLFELTRHSDHHYKASRKYQILRHFDESPQLPTGYPGSMILATVPPLWYMVMNKRVNAIQPSFSDDPKEQL